jgi:hypothetical protein
MSFSQVLVEEFLDLDIEYLLVLYGLHMVSMVMSVDVFCWDKPGA